MSSIPTTITQLPDDPNPSGNSLLLCVNNGVTYKVQANQLLATGGVLPTRQVIAGTGLQGGGPLSADVTVSIAPGGVGANELAATGVTPGVYGDANFVPQITIDADGRVTAATSVSNSTLITAAAASALAASNSAAAALTSETNAGASATAAAASVTTAATSATNAATSAAAAAASSAAATLSASNAALSETNANLASSSATSSASTASAAVALAETAAATATSNASTATTAATNASNSATAAATSASSASNSANASQASASNAANSATAAATSANGAQTSYLAAAGLYGDLAAVQSAVTTSGTNASAAATSAASASTSASSANSAAAQAVQAWSAASAPGETLAAVSAQALHRSPNAITALFTYDTSKDSDGGAWTEKCQSTSWYNETLSGNWLGSQVNETNARYVGASLGTELVPNATFNADVTGWAASGAATITWSNGELYAIANTTSGEAKAVITNGITTVVGKTYKVTFDIYSPNGALLYAGIGLYAGGSNMTGWAVSAVASSKVKQTFTFVFTSTQVTAYPCVMGYQANIKSEIYVDNFSIREVTALNTASNDYFQLTTNGKFYRLWNNLLRYTSDFTQTAWEKTNATVSGSTVLVSANGRICQYLTAPVFGTHTTNVELSGSGTVTLGVMTNGYVLLGSRSITLTGTPTSYSVSGAMSGSNTLVGIIIQSAAGATVTIGVPQLEYGSTATTYEPKTSDGSTSEVFRGNKRNFPKLAGIVAEAASVTIYDLTEPGRPMWMRFVGAGSTAPNSAILGSTTDTTGSISLLNANLIVGINNATTVNGFRWIDFAKDSGFKYGAGVNVRLTGGIVNRNSTTSTVIIASPLPYQIVNNTVNSVAMTVLPDAPVDPVTGLKVPTIAVGTAGGVSVIRHSGSVESTAVQSGWGIVSVSFNGSILFASDGQSSTYSGLCYWDTKQTLPSGSVGNPLALVGWPSALSHSYVSATGVRVPDSFPSSKNATQNKFLVSAGASGAATAVFNQLNTKLSVRSAITSTYNTGHMTGDIRRAYLSDITAGSVSGTELVTNGTFDVDTAGWTNLGGATVSGGTINISTSTSAYWIINQTLTTIAGRKYQITLDITSIANNGGTAYVGVGWGAGNGVGQYQTTGTKTITVTATGASVVLCFYFLNATASLDNISVQEVVPDRSYKAAAANILGTLSKTAVGTGNQLVAYSGFSAADYIQEPYSADLDFGTGEWSVGSWVNVPVAYKTGGNFFPYSDNILVWGYFGLYNGNGAEAPLYTFTRTANYALDHTGTATTASRITLTGGTTNTWVNYFGLGYPTAFPAYSPHYITVSFWAKTNNGATFTCASALYGGANFGSYTITPTWTYFTGTVNAALYNLINGIIYPLAFTCPIATTMAIDISVENLQVNVGSSATTFIATNGAAVYPTSVVYERNAASGASVKLYETWNGKLSATAFDGTTTRTVTTTAAYNTGTWNKVDAYYKTDGSLSIAVNGVQVATAAGTPLLTLNNASAVLTIGNSYALDAPFPGSLCLTKFSATVPTSEQLTYMYEQEKQMFATGAQVCLPDSGSIVDLTYDDMTDTWIAASAANESYWSGLVRVKTEAVSAGSYTKLHASSGVHMAARSTTNPGVDVTIPAYNLREKSLEKAANLAKTAGQIVPLDYVGGFTGNTTAGSTAIASVASLTYPTSYIGARITGSGIPANTYITAVSGTTIYISAAATATATGVQIQFVDFILPVGYTTRMVTVAGTEKQEGSTKDFTRLFDGFKETIRFGTAPAYNAWVQIQSTKDTSQ